VREAVSVDNQILFPKVYHDAVRAFCEAPADGRSRFLERTGVRVCVLDREPPASFDTVEPIEDIAPVRAFKDSRPFARCSVVATPPAVADVASGWRALFDGGFDPASSVVVDRETAAFGIGGAPAPPDARIVRDAANAVEVDASAPEGATLVLYDSYDPGWKATVDGQPADVVRADGLFRAVRLAPGRHHVSFVYRPASLVYGAVLSALAVALLLGLGIYARFVPNGGTTASANRTNRGE
jgi:hypothetical protein